MNEKLKAYEEKMTKTMGNLDGELGAIRAGRANPNVLNKIMEDDLQKLTDKYVKEVDKAVEAKSKEVMTV